MQEYTINVPFEDSNTRIDLCIFKFSSRNNLGFSRTLIQHLIHNNGVTLNNSALAKPHHKVKDGDRIKISFEEKKAESLSVQDIPLEIVYEDADIAIINKPAGLVTHPAPGNYEHTLVNALLYRFKTLSSINPNRPGIVHRLDKETSGLMVIAKTNTAHLDLARRFAKHSIKRKYIALVKGNMEFDENIIEMPIGRHPYKRKEMAVSFAENSRYAKTFYRTLKRSNEVSLLELEPFTGRTHQLRVHLAFLGHPIMGDTKYGKNNTAPRLMLHSKYIGLIHSVTGKFIEFFSNAPEGFEFHTNNP